MHECMLDFMYLVVSIVQRAKRVVDGILLDADRLLASRTPAEPYVPVLQDVAIFAGISVQLDMRLLAAESSYDGMLC